MWAPSWNWVLVANVLLGVSQGLTWSTTVIMKIDLAGPARRGLAMGLNEFAGYLAVAVAALATGYLAATLRPPAVSPSTSASASSSAGCSYRSSSSGRPMVTSLTRRRAAPTRRRALSQRRGLRAHVADRPRTSRAVSQAGLVNNLNDGMAWGLFPLLFAAAGHQPRADRGAGRGLSGGVGPRTARHGRPVRSARTQVADRLGHVGAGRRHRHRCGLRRGVRASSPATCFWAWARPWSTRPSWPRSRMSRIRRGEPPPSASTGSGEISAMPSARSSRALRRTGLECGAQYGSWLRSRVARE